jgi:hypothetical protein
VVTVIHDLPHGAIRDREDWRERREMAEDWHRRITGFADSCGVTVNPMVTYEATGAHNGEMPEFGMRGGERVRLGDVIGGSTIVIAMTQFSASAPLLVFTRRHQDLRVASMPTVARSMEETALSADYRRVGEACARIAPLFERAEGIEVTFSTGHTCRFDVSDHNVVFQDNGQLHPDAGGDATRLCNLPAGEVCACPNEAAESRTAGEIPAVYGDETVVFVVKNNRIVDVMGDGPAAAKKREAFRGEPAMQNIAEVAIGCNDRAAVTGNILEDEKAGFHWAYGRSDHLGGTVGVADFSSPGRVCHIDIVYARGNPVVCARLDFVFPDGTRTTGIRDGALCV